MHKHVFSLFVMLLFIHACATMGASQKNAESPASPPLTSILDSPGLKAFKRTLNQIVLERNPGTGQSQHFFVSKYSENESLAYMFWQEKKLLWIMSLGATDEESWLGVRYPSSGQLIDLKNSVVASVDDVGGSSYLVTKEWAAERLFDTVVHGDLIVISQ
ncbi:hypothetical protein FKG94_11835 [Exilibacterium tricleocarpae]|uniref:Uncharacterized protein n=1 Tax=Exilibacterium tricleocarpae TaxID=2591008 RepID=A0A545TNA6_9GAMM|nr:hypothetical protein [Exilibacterium tricleocarpae]TQV78712.1 hypothetical protein FKG94_11835 [Exilibacterium tricleocarpae]